MPPSQPASFPGAKLQKNAKFPAQASPKVSRYLGFAFTLRHVLPHVLRKINQRPLGRLASRREQVLNYAWLLRWRLRWDRTVTANIDEALLGHVLRLHIARNWLGHVLGLRIARNWLGHVLGLRIARNWLGHVLRLRIARNWLGHELRLRIARN